LKRRETEDLVRFAIARELGARFEAVFHSSSEICGDFPNLIQDAQTEPRGLIHLRRAADGRGAHDTQFPTPGKIYDEYQRDMPDVSRDRTESALFWGGPRP
jgi:hypothetical protein